MSNLIPFTYGETPVRVVEIDGEPWFVLSDLCKVLGLQAPHMVAGRLSEDDRSSASVIDSLGRPQHTTIVNEAGMYEVVIRSDKPEAVAFRRWITGEVLPAIRKTGSYGTPDLATAIATMTTEQWVGLATTLTERAELAEHQVQQLTPGASAWDHLASTADDYSVQQAATILARDPSITIGRQRLFDWLDGAGWTYRDRGTRARMAYQKSIEMGRLAHRAQHHIHPRTGEVVLDPPQVRVTVKGLTTLHRALGGSAPLAIGDPVPQLEAVSS